jgi:hypothetical protein
MAGVQGCSLNLQIEETKDSMIPNAMMLRNLAYEPVLAYDSGYCVLALSMYVSTMRTRCSGIATVVLF